MTLTIRDAKPDDAAGIVAVFNPIIAARSFTLFDTPFSVETERSYIEQLSERDIFHVAIRTSDDAVVGFQSMSPFATYTHALDHVGVIGTYVDLGSRRQGIAKALFPATFEAAQRKVENLTRILGEPGHRLAYEELIERRKEAMAMVGDAEKEGATIAGRNFRDGIESVATAAAVGDS